MKPTTLKLDLKQEVIDTLITQRDKPKRSLSRVECITYLMAFYKVHQDEFLELDEIKVFNSWADMNLFGLQITVCTITMLVNDSKYTSALSMFLDQLNLNK
jgi:hypothetical protein